MQENTLAPNKAFYPFSKFQTNAITAWLVERLEKGTVAGPFDSEKDVGFPVYTVPIFTVPKPELGKYRIIQNFSYKYGKFSSINDHIKPENVTLQYVSITELPLVVYTAGEGAYMCTRDLDQAYYLLPLNPSEFPLMEFKWAGKLWIFKVAGMGVASSPRSFTRFVDPIEFYTVKRLKHIAFKNGVQMVRHYADDFFGCASDKETAQKLFDGLGVSMAELNTPPKEKKDIYPTQCLKLLGEIFESRIEPFIDVSNQRKFKALCYLVFIKLVGRIHKKQLEKLDGVLNCIARLKFPAKAFLRRFQAIVSDPRLSYGEWILVEQFIGFDVDWWIQFLSTYDGTRCKIKYFLRSPDQADHVIFTDAAGDETRRGVGGTIDGKYAFQIKWKDTIWDQVVAARPDADIQLQEYLGAAVALDLFRDILTDSCVTLYNDNPGAASALICKAPRLWRSDMQCLTRHIAMCAIEENVVYWGVKIDGKDNDHADALSRFKKYDWNEIGYIMRDPKPIINKYLAMLLSYPPNREKSEWQWTEAQKELLRINKTRRLIEQKRTHLTKPKRRNTNYNILTRKQFD